MIGHTVHLFCPRPPKTVCTDTAHDAESGWKVVIILEAHHSLLPDQPPLASVQRCRVLLLSRLNSACNASINGIDCVVFMLCVLHSKWIVYWPCTKRDVGQAATGRQEKMLKHFGSTTLGCSVLRALIWHPLTYWRFTLFLLWGGSVPLRLCIQHWQTPYTLSTLFHQVFICEFSSQNLIKREHFFLYWLRLTPDNWKNSQLAF